MSRYPPFPANLQTKDRSFFPLPEYVMAQVMKRKSCKVFKEFKRPARCELFQQVQVGISYIRSVNNFVCFHKACNFLNFFMSILLLEIKNELTYQGSLKPLTMTTETQNSFVLILQNYGCTISKIL